ncbi:hypothetical protein ACBI99_39775 [Nonomuraea sp. ATR24]|uniref:hypothetical protein n=1 Tax=Nonomuraea sp. ATR24 TaxID=1676744 RepID=UPI0035C13CB0
MAMRDVSRRVLELHPGEPFRAGPGGAAETEPRALLGGGELRKFGWKVLDASMADGITYAPVPFGSASISEANRAVVAGRAFALERDTGTTRLFFVWLPSALADRLAKGTMTGPLNFHVIFHTPTYLDSYVKSRPYWTGKNPSDRVAYYVRLGARYLSTDFRAVAHHVMAVTARDPNLAYVVPIADLSGNLSDLTTPGGLLGALTEVNAALAALLSGPAPSGKVGGVMLSAYSHSGDRIVALMRHISGAPFFTEHLMQINAFDVNLGDNDQQRLPELARMWEGVRQWATLNRRARAYVYTAYRSHYAQCLASPVPRGAAWTDRADVKLDDVTWSDSAAKAAPGQSRGVASEAYGPDGRFGVVCLPVSFFRFYLENHHHGKTEIIGNTARGWHDGEYDIGRAHGHGLFLRGLMSHAVARADPVFFAPVRRVP